MSDIPTIPPEDDDMLAAEMALGLAEGEALAVGQARLRADVIFAGRVANWQERFVAMTDDIKPVKPPRRLKKRITATLFPKVRVPLTQRLWVWQGISIAAIGMVAYLGVQMIEERTRPTGPRVFAAQLAGDSAIQMLAVVDPVAQTIALRRTAGAAAANRVLELWAILPDQAPISLGVLPDAPTARIAVPETLEGRAAEITLAISDEPPGGSTTGAPTGAVLAVGSLSEL